MGIQPADRLKSAGEYYFSKKLDEVRRMNASGLDVINLGIGSPDLSPPEGAMAEACATIRRPGSHGYAPYRSGLELRRAMADFYLRCYGVKLDPDSEVLPLLGSKEGILYLSMAYLNPGDGVLVPNPGYPAYSSVAKLIGAEVLSYDLLEENGWLPDFDQIESLARRNCKMMWVNYPHMPTGASADPMLFDRLIAFGRKNGILICSDNPYGLVLNSSAPRSILSADPEMKTSVELNSLSKSFNMAGWRIGMLMGHREAVNAVIQVKSNVDSGMFEGVQAGAVAALSASNEWHVERNRIYQERREIVWRIFDQLGFMCDRGQSGLFVWAKAPDTIADVEEFLDQVLKRARVFFTPGFIFGSNGVRYGRSSLCVTLERLKEAERRVLGEFGGQLP